MNYFRFTSNEDYFPEVIFNKEILEIKGQSYMEDPFSFFLQLIDSIRKHKNDLENIEVSIKLEYFNTSTSKCLYDMCEILNDSGVKNINWYYHESDEDSYDEIIEMEKALGFKINKKIYD